MKRDAPPAAEAADAPDAPDAPARADAALPRRPASAGGRGAAMPTGATSRSPATTRRRARRKPFVL